MKLFVFAVACITLQVNGQFFGGRTPYQFGGYNDQIGLKAGPAWGSLSQDTNRFGFTGPKTYGGGLDLLTPKGTGLTGSFQQQHGLGGGASLGAQANLFSHDKSNVNAWAKHDRNLDKNFRIVGPETNSGGLTFKHDDGANAFASVSKTNGFPSVKSVGAGVPLFTSKDGNMKLSVEGSSNFQSGRPRNDQALLKLEGTF